MFTMIQRFLALALRRRPATRLSEAEARAIAKAAVADGFFKELMTVTSLEQRDGRVL